MTPQYRDRVETETKAETEAETDSCPAPSLKVAALIPSCTDEQFTVTEEKRTEYQATYPGVEVDLELKAVRQWCIDNPTRRKTLKGIPRFLNAWLSKAQNSGRRSKPTEKSYEDRVAEIEKVSREMKK